MEHLGKAFGGTDLLNIYLKGLFGYVLSFSILDTLKANKNKKTKYIAIRLWRLA